MTIVREASGSNDIGKIRGEEFSILPDAASLPQNLASGNNMENGWIRLWRNTLDDVIWKRFTSDQKVVMITLLLLANHEDNEWLWKGKKFIVKSGQKITSIESIKKAAGFGLTSQKIRTALKKLEKVGFLTNQSTKEGRLITIVNWQKYQNPNKQPNRHLTNDQQTPNKGLTTNKNDKNEENEKERKKEKEKSTPPSLIEQFNLTKGVFTEAELKLQDDFIDYWREKSVGGKKERWQMEKVFDVRRRFRTWIKNQKKFGKFEPDDEETLPRF